jgi:hypothetical protein
LSSPTIIAQPAASAVAPRSETAAGFVFGPMGDGFLLIGAPVLALGAGILVAETAPSSYSFMMGESPNRVAHLLMFMFTMAHLAAVFFRSHGNPKIFKLYPLRFTVAPLLLFALMCASQWILVSVIVLGVWWDVYHSSAQTFGLCRIYDMKRGNSPEAGRQLDYWLNILLYCGPILAGVTLFDHLHSFDSYNRVGATFYQAMPRIAASYQPQIRFAMLAIGVPFLAYYVWSYARLARQGYKISPQKTALLASTGFVSIVTWGFNSFGEAFFIMNFFHALQYFAIVWWSEKKNIQRLFGYEEVKNGSRKAFVLFLTIPFLFGAMAAWAGSKNIQILLNVQIVVSIMHFWYDGFIWSVRKKQVAAG